MSEFSVSPVGPTSGDPIERSLDGGSIEGEQERPVGSKGPFDIEQHRGQVTVWLLLLLAVLILGNYTCVLIMEWNGKKVEAIGNAFNASLPIVSGLVGPAVTYYFTRERKP